MGACVKKLSQGGLDSNNQRPMSPSRRKQNYEVEEQKEQAPSSKGQQMASKPGTLLNKKKDLSNFQFKDERDKFLSKLPGTLNGQQFRIQNCNECNIYVHENHDQCFIDLCNNCVIVMGPCSSSTFIRNCKDCKFIITCQQLRMRDCVNVEVMLFSQTQPVIESSSGISFFCHQYFYPELPKQMKAAKISYWNNKWNDIFDFTPNKIASQGLNYSVSLDPTPGFVSSLSQMQKIITQIEGKKGFKIDNLKEIGEEDLNLIDLTLLNDPDQPDVKTLIPHTLGQSGKWKSTEECFIFLFLLKADDLYADNTLQLMYSMQEAFLDNEAYFIQECRSTELNKEQVLQLHQKVGIPTKLISIDKVMTVGIHLKADKSKDGYQLPFADVVSHIIQNNTNLRIEATNKESQVQKASELIFRTFNIEHTGHNIAGGK